MGVPSRQPKLSSLAVSSSVPKDATAIVLGIQANDSSAEGLSLVSGELLSNAQSSLLSIAKSLGAKGKANELTRIPVAALSLPEQSLGGVLPKDYSRELVILTVGLGTVTTEDQDLANAIRSAAATAARSLAGHDTVAVSISDPRFIKESAEGFALGSYIFDDFRSTAGTQPVQTAVFIAPETQHEAAQETIYRTSHIVQGVGIARDLVNTPPNVLFPDSFARRVIDLVRPTRISFEILDEKELNDQGYGGITAVGKGSTRPPRLVRLEYNPDLAISKSSTNPEPPVSTNDESDVSVTESPGADASSDIYGTLSPSTVALVGKGITFDTGGISLKPGAGMADMTSDMGGAASVVGTILAAERLGLPVRVIAYLALAENMPSGTSYRPGDVITQYGGTTVEVLNTDAEGRLVLADAIVRAGEDNPDYLIDIATLTGAQLVALGSKTAGVMGDPEFRDRVARLSTPAGEPGWPMPLPADLLPQLDSHIADLANIGSTRWGGMLLAGVFLQQFVPSHVEWVHLDVAGPAYNKEKPSGTSPQGGTGVPVRTLIAVLEDISTYR